MDCKEPARNFRTSPSDWRQEARERWCILCWAPVNSARPGAARKNFPRWLVSQWIRCESKLLTMAEYAFEQGLTPNDLDIADLFAAQTLDWDGPASEA
jgi:hypothetical protein